MQNNLKQTKTNIQVLMDIIGTPSLKTFTFEPINRLNLKDGKIHNFLYDPESGIIISIKEPRRLSEKLWKQEGNIRIYTHISTYNK